MLEVDTTSELRPRTLSLLRKVGLQRAEVEGEGNGQAGGAALGISSPVSATLGYTWHQLGAYPTPAIPWLICPLPHCLLGTTCILGSAVGDDKIQSSLP